jgi:hypothetical protein
MGEDRLHGAYSGWVPAFVASSRHLMMSAAMMRPKSSGVPPRRECYRGARPSCGTFSPRGAEARNQLFGEQRTRQSSPIQAKGVDGGLK